MLDFPRSLPRICVALGLPTASQLSKAAEAEYKDGATLLEFRLDFLADPASGIEALTAFRKRYPDAQILATCRSRRAKGRFGGTIERQLKLLNAAITAGASIVDVEIESAEEAREEITGMREATRLLVSYHNFTNTPALPPVLRRLRRVPADAYKIATTARKPSDNLRLVEFARELHGTRFILLAMSETGTPTRVLAPSLGSLFTYASPINQDGTAPGQISAKLLRTLYRAEKLNKESRIYGVIASPVGHSKSPVIHNRALHARRVDAVYLPFLVAAPQLGDWMRFAEGLPVSGFSVTIPHKQRIIRHLQIVDPLARRIGAVNTVWRKAGKWRGTNTDAQGVVKPLASRMRLSNSTILVAGYGGAARAAAIALSDAGASVTITGRNLRSAQTLARQVKGEAVTLKESQERSYDALVHATPVGMAPKAGECLFGDGIPADVVLDMVYNPHETLLLKRAKQEGCTVIPGSEMLLEQAAAQFEIWTGETAPRSLMKEALEQHF